MAIDPVREILDLVSRRLPERATEHVRVARRRAATRPARGDQSEVCVVPQFRDQVHDPLLTLWSEPARNRRKYDVLERRASRPRSAAVPLGGPHAGFETHTADRDLTTRPLTLQQARGSRHHRARQRDADLRAAERGLAAASPVPRLRIAHRGPTPVVEGEHGQTSQGCSARRSNPPSRALRRIRVRVRRARSHQVVRGRAGDRCLLSPGSRVPPPPLERRSGGGRVTRERTVRGHSEARAPSRRPQSCGEGCVATSVLATSAKLASIEKVGDVPEMSRGVVLGGRGHEVDAGASRPVVLVVPQGRPSVR